MNHTDFNLYLITDRLNIPAGKTLLGQVEAALQGGVKAVQLREKDLSPEELLPLAWQLRKLTRQYGAKLLINSCLETVLAVTADGLHLSSDNPDIIEAREKLGPDSLIGVSTHSIDQVKHSVSAKADFVTFGPVYYTRSKAGYGKPVGLTELQKACAISSIPVFALGGITADRLAQLREADCSHYACIGAILNSDDPELTTRSFLTF